MKKVLNIIKIIIIVLLTIIALLNVTLLFQSVVLKKDLPDIFGYSYLKVKTGSMAPTYNIGDVVITKKENIYSINDVAIYKENDSFIMHRIVEENDEYYIFKGDANNTSEEINKSDVVAKVIYKNNYITDIITILQNKIVLILIIVVIMLLMFI